MLSQKKFSKIIKIAAFVFVIAFAIFLLADKFAFAANLDVGMEYAAQTGLPDQDIKITIAKIIRIVIGFLGIIAVGLIMYAGWLWMSSEGNEEKVLKAKQVLKNAIIGLIIILSAFAIVSFIINKLIAAYSGDAGGGPGGGNYNGIAALGSGIIEAHYPGRGQTDVPRNTKIVVTFKEAMDVASLMNGANMNSDNIKIYKSVDGSAGPYVTEVTARKTTDDKSFTFKPVQYLGSSAEKVWYTVALSKNIKKANGDAAFGSVVGDVAYTWSFEVSTLVDVTPPQIESVIPQPSASEPRNVVVQINFNEAIDPTSASGQTKNGFNNIVVSEKGGSAVAGNYYIANQYKTVEFLTDVECGKNSCGNTVYCLPGGKDLSALAKAQTLTIADEYDGVVDMCDNSLDGNKNGTAQGPESQSGLPPYNENSPDNKTQGDDYTWSFKTTNEIDITAPSIVSIAPAIKEYGVLLNAIPEAKFSKLMMASSMTSTNVLFTSNPAGGINYWMNCVNNMLNKQTAGKINHDQFNENTNYMPQFTSGLKDIYQNCYKPCSGQGVTGAPSCCNGTANSQNKCW